jgi:hypothetical protein
MFPETEFIAVTAYQVKLTKFIMSLESFELKSKKLVGFYFMTAHWDAVMQNLKNKPNTKCSEIANRPMLCAQFSINFQFHFLGSLLFCS